MLLWAGLILPLSHCVPGCVNNKTGVSTTQENPPESAVPGEEMLSILQGSWEEKGNTGNQMVIMGDKSRYYSNGEQTAMYTLLIDGNCADTVCVADAHTPGWCIQEINEAGALARCSRVTKCDSVALTLIRSDAAGDTLLYKKLR
jgi:hypothetical protein